MSDNIALMKINKFVLILLTLPFLYSCRVYKANIMFKVDPDGAVAVDSMLRKSKNEADLNFVISKNDYISIKVYTHNGERIIDPDYELMKNTQMSTMQQQELRYLVRQNGKVFLPMVGDLKIEGYTIRQADSIFSKEYGKYYLDVYVNTKIVNKRIVVLGALGGKVIPLENDNISVIEAIALYGGVNTDSRAKNIRLIRGDLKEPEVRVIDLSTIQGMKKASLDVEPNDIIYIEPVKRNMPQFLQDIFPILSVATSIITTVLLIANLNK